MRLSGLAGDANQAYACELAERGFITIAPDAIGFEERTWSPDRSENISWPAAQDSKPVYAGVADRAEAAQHHRRREVDTARTCHCFGQAHVTPAWTLDRSVQTPNGTTVSPIARRA